MAKTKKSVASKSKQPEIELTVRCIKCRATKVLSSKDGPYTQILLCPNDGMPMVAAKARWK